MITIPYYETSFFALHNFSANAIEIDGVIYPTAEHAFHALKFDDPAIRNEIISSSSPVAAFNLGKKYKPVRRSNWNDIKCCIKKALHQGRHCTARGWNVCPR